MIRTATPSLVSQSASTSPVGPAPTINTGTFDVSAGRSLSRVIARRLLECRTGSRSCDANEAPRSLRSIAAVSAGGEETMLRSSVLCLLRDIATAMAQGHGATLFLIHAELAMQ